MKEWRRRAPWSGSCSVRGVRFARLRAPTFSEIRVLLGARRLHFRDDLAALDVDRLPFLERAGRQVAPAVQLGQPLEFLSKKISRDHGAPHSVGRAAGIQARTIIDPLERPPRPRRDRVVELRRARRSRREVRALRAFPSSSWTTRPPTGPRRSRAPPGARVIEAGANLGFGPACNRAARKGAPSEAVLFLNPDAALVDGEATLGGAPRGARRRPGRRRRRPAPRRRGPGGLPAAPPPARRLDPPRGAPRGPPPPGQRRAPPRPLPRPSARRGVRRRAAGRSRPPRAAVRLRRRRRLRPRVLPRVVRGRGPLCEAPRARAPHPLRPRGRRDARGRRHDGRASLARLPAALRAQPVPLSRAPRLVARPRGGLGRRARGSRAPPRPRAVRRAPTTGARTSPRRSSACSGASSGSAGARRSCRGTRDAAASSSRS